MAKTNGIRVNTGAKKIEVNDNGDFIMLNLNDEGFAKRYLDMLDFFQEKARELEPQFKLIDEQEETFDNMGISNDVKQAIKLSTDFHEKIRDCIDNVFGKDACLKVFGPILPSSEMYFDFFEQIAPYFEAFGKERAKKTNKYNAGRTGNV